MAVIAATAGVALVAAGAVARGEVTWRSSPRPDAERRFLQRLGGFAAGTGGSLSLPVCAPMACRGSPTPPAMESSRRSGLPQFGVGSSQFQAAQAACRGLRPTDGSLTQAADCLMLGQLSRGRGGTDTGGRAEVRPLHALPRGAELARPDPHFPGDAGLRRHSGRYRQAVHPFVAVHDTERRMPASDRRARAEGVSVSMRDIARRPLRAARIAAAVTAAVGLSLLAAACGGSPAVTWRSSARVQRRAAHRAAARHTSRRSPSPAAFAPRRAALARP